CFPARGYMPVEFFRGSWAWNVTLNPKRFEMPDKDAIKPNIQRIDKDGEKMGQPLKLESVNVNKQPFGVPGCIIFRPEDFSMLAGRRYLVEIEGIQPRGATESVTLHYVVEFISSK
ncbi:MAG: hypothetical protein L0219_01910, partial [Phycisphaerales bacterium]|nr:hypothetical protein [Phycisphaerales bacterium]